jgi:hypothetical protein
MDPIIVRAVQTFIRDVDSRRAPLTAQGMRHGAEFAWEFAEGGGYGAGAFGDAVHQAKRQGLTRDVWIEACLAAFRALARGKATA